MNIAKKLKKDSVEIIGHFVLVNMLRRRNLDATRRTSLLLYLLQRMKRFKVKRLNVYKKDENIEELLNSMHTHLNLSMNEIKLGLCKIEEVYTFSNDMQENQKEIKKQAKKIQKLSTCLHNLALYMTEYGPHKPIRSLLEIESNVLLQPDEA